MRDNMHAFTVRLSSERRDLLDTMVLEEMTRVAGVVLVSHINAGAF